MINNLFYKFKYFKFKPLYHVGDSGVTVIMAASQAVDPGSTPGSLIIHSTIVSGYHSIVVMHHTVNMAEESSILSDTLYTPIYI